MAAKLQPVTRIRTCRACGKQFEYPVKGSSATRHHCEDCVRIDPDTRKVLERLCGRIQKLETQLKQASSPVSQ